MAGGGVIQMLSARRDDFGQVNTTNRDSQDGGGSYDHNPRPSAARQDDIHDTVEWSSRVDSRRHTHGEGRVSPRTFLAFELLGKAKIDDISYLSI